MQSNGQQSNEHPNISYTYAPPMPLKFSPTLWMQIGDPQQLAPTVVLKEAQINGYADSMMYQLMTNHRQPHEMLDIQYRMHPTICQWISAQFYENQLRTADSVLRRTSVLTTHPLLDPTLKKPSLFFNISRGKEQRFGDEHSASISNHAEANAIVRMTCYLLFVCKFLPEDIGVITFYSAQVALIKDLFEQALRDRRMPYGEIKQLKKTLLIHTVDGFQGGEKKITLVSVVRTSESVGFLNDLRRLNVAMSRTEDARWVFGKRETLNNSNSVFPSLLSDIHANVIEEDALNRMMR